MMVTSGELLAAVLAALAAALLVSSPAGGVFRATRTTERDLVSRWTGVLRVFDGRPDATSLRRRLLVSLAAAIALGGALQQATRLGVVVWMVVPILGPLGVLVLGRLEPVASRRRRVALGLDLPQALELMAACLAAGMPLRSATAAVAGSFRGPIAEDLGRVLALVNLGASDVEAWASLRVVPQWRATVVDLARSVESGTRLVDVLLQHASDARNRRRADVEVRAKAVGVRSVLPLMTCFLPAFLLMGVIPTVASALLRAFH